MGAAATCLAATSCWAARRSGAPRCYSGCDDTHARSLRYLRELDEDPTPIFAYLRQVERVAGGRFHTLGHYFAVLVEFWLVHGWSPEQV